MNDTIRPGRIHEITAVSNPRIKSIKGLALKKNRDLNGTFLVEGLKLVRDAFELGWQIDTFIYASTTNHTQQIEELAARIRVKGADILEVNEKVLSSITRKDNPQMVMAVVKQRWKDQPDQPSSNQTVWIALDRVRDPGNLGTIMRTADSSGVEGILLIGDTTDPFSLEATRASMGSIFNVPLVRMNEEAFLEWRLTWSGKVIGTHLEGAVDFRSIDYTSKPVLLVMGNEQQGLTDVLAETCDELALIPMHGSADSLNLAIATGVMLFTMGKKLPPIKDKSK